MQNLTDRIEIAIQDLKQGKMVILTDHTHRENEGDLIFPAETITPEIMNFMIRNGTGIVCLSLTEERLKNFDIPLMVEASHNTAQHQTPFTISIDAKNGITTGVSAADRVITIRTLMASQAQPGDVVRPGHIFPLQAKPDGVLARAGHTEGSIDLMRLAGFKPAAVICEIMNPDGTMAKGKQLEAFAKTHQLTLITIDDLITHRLRTENLIEQETSATLPLEHYGQVTITVIKEKINRNEHIILSSAIKEHQCHTPLIRIHSSCITGDLFHSKRCDCNEQLHYSLQRISQEGGLLIYLNQEGRGIGLFNKIKAYALQEEGLDTIEANKELGLPIDARQYYIAAHILRHFHITHLKLLTNNPLKVNDLKKYGNFYIEQISLPTFRNKHNIHYLNVKKNKLNHLIENL